MHKPSSIQLAHAGINQGIPRLPFTPLLKVIFIFRPWYSIVGRFERTFFNMREMPQYHLIELAPDKFIQPGLVFLQRKSDEMSNADGTEAQMNAQPRSAANGRDIPRLIVFANNR